MRGPVKRAISAHRLVRRLRSRMFMDARGSLWAIVLAGGDGTRLASLTEQLYGEPLPKQFAVLAGDRSLLQATIDRLSPIVPPSRTTVVVPAAYEALARKQLADYRGVHVVTQPANRGTGPGILLPLAHVLAADPLARVVVAPSDHYLARPAALRAAIVAAAVEATQVSLTLVGAEADHPETEYGWIEPGGIKAGRVRRIVHFVEKPSPARARELFERGCLWNTFVMVGYGARIWRIAEQRMPAPAAAIRACVIAHSSKGPCLARAYSDMETVNFSHAVLEQVPDLGVVSARACGFSDWGSPDRVLASLRGTADHERLLARMGSRESNRAGHISQGPEMTTLLSRSGGNASTSQQKGSQP